MTGFLAYSMAGHDKGRVYLIIDEAGDFVYVADGAVRTLDRPKKKNKKHIQIIRIDNPRIDIPSVTDEQIKYSIKLYLRGIKEVK